MRQNLRIAFRMTVVTTILFGLVYPLVVTGLGQLFFPSQANGGLIVHNGQTVGARLIGQPFSSDRYFRGRPSAAGNGYDPVFSGGGASNLGPTNRQLLDRIEGDVQKLHEENSRSPIPVELVTTSGSGLDPEISPAGAEFQIPRVARARHISEEALRALVAKHTLTRQLGVFGEPRINVLELNLDLDAQHSLSKSAFQTPSFGSTR